MKEKDQLIIDEGVRLHPYYCTSKCLTIGVGRNLDDNPLTSDEVKYLMKRREHISAENLIADFWVNGITMDEAHYLLENDMKRFDAELRRRIAWYGEAPEEVQGILLNMAFNMGVTRLLGFHATLPLIESGQYFQAGENLKVSLWAKQVKNRATRLIGRLQKLQQ
jgi:lysozyme